MNQIIKISLAVTILGTAAVIACNKKLNYSDQNNPTTDSYFKTAAELRNGVDAVYSSLHSANLAGREWFFTHDMRGGETGSGGAQLEAPRAELLTQPSPSPSNAVMTSVWTGTYEMINRANLVISKAPGVKDDPASAAVIVGEAEFLRAWAYFELVTMWGDVPLYTVPVTSVTGYKGKTPAADVYTQIISDLTDAAAKLPNTHSTDGRATMDAANFLLGKVLMQKGDYAGAKAALLKVYGKYSLMSNFLYNFDGDVKLASNTLATGHEFNAESIFEIVFIDKGDDNFNWGYTGEGATADESVMRSQEYGIVWGNVVPSNAILNEFEAGDPRYKFTFYESGDNILTFAGTQAGTPLTESGMNVAPSNHNGTIQRRVYRKYSVLDWTNDGFHPDGLNFRIMRYAEVLLMLAECEAEVGTPAQAAIYINQVRSRPSVNMPPVTLTNHDNAIQAVMHEKAVEMAGEEVNNIDMLRWRAKGYYPSLHPDPKPGQVALFPIPASETSANPMIK
ncbi:RagB/SusD family nutrient uptake outer membrane protein [Puia dinghuensis]|uniref:Membrane protein n=1 Tax=Puia dinghuensis TaxID=1792502 RepID=A0A8J2XN17_9BACT|nr:RagB/SusD family nutrient uptake outer membrane protein [Puia dinghuensis]GGA82063.1 membrane protein [Puia dinghuensis]